MDVLPLCHYFAYESKMVVEGQGYFIQCLSLQIILPVVDKPNLLRYKASLEVVLPQSKTSNYWTGYHL